MGKAGHGRIEPDAPPRHEWIIAPRRREQIKLATRHGAIDHAIDAHRARYGPFGAAGDFVRALFDRHPATAARAATARLVTLLAVVPDLRARLPVPAAVERSFAFSREGNRRSWSLRIAHGLVDFVLDCLAGEALGTGVLFHGADHADVLDLQFLHVLLRRADPRLLRVCVSSAADDIAAFTPCASVERVRSVHGRSADGSLAKVRPKPAVDEPWTLAKRYVEADCVDDDPLAQAAYAALGEAERSALHLERIATLERNEPAAAALGALPFHHERAGTGPEALAAASDRCMHLAWYEAALDWANRARALCDPLVHAALIGVMTRNSIFALLLLDRYDEAAALCARCLADSRDPALLSHTCYAQAILHARLNDPSRRDYPAARGWIERALAFGAELPPSEVRATNLAFLRNTLALIEMRCGNGAEALRLLTDAIAYLAREAPARFAIESVILFHNRARLHRAAGDPDTAIADLTAALALEPSNAEALFDRGLLHQSAGRHADAVRDYDAALRWAPPDANTHLNRARSLGMLGRREDALADYGRVLTIDPDNLHALIDRACMRRERRDSAAREDVAHGLAIDSRNARLLCLRGLEQLADGLLDRALASLDAAIVADPGLADAWANRATIRHRLGRIDDALADLEQALGLRDDPSIRGNRARILKTRAARV